ncbi:MAG: D-aminoacyl-tRNA deacylase, partial [Saprospiraceae bacterium]
MRVILQRVSQASVTIGGQEKSRIGPGLLILLGIETADDETDGDWLSQKIAAMRIFSDAEGKMNRSVQETGGEILVVSQFTLFAGTKKGNRPSFIRAARPEMAIPLYKRFVKQVAAAAGCRVATGEFGADMQVALV